MSAKPNYPADLGGTLLNKFAIGFQTAKAFLKYASGGFVVRDATDAADAPLTASQLNASGNDIVWNSDSAGTGADWNIIVRRPSSGMSADWILTLPVDDGSPGQVLTTDGAGVTSWTTVTAGATNMVLTDDTALVFGSTSTLTLFTKPAGSKVPRIIVDVATAFNGTAPTVSLGISGSLSKYAGTDDIDLTLVGMYIIYPDVGTVVGSENLIATYAAGSSSAGAATISIDYVVPS